MNRRDFIISSFMLGLLLSVGVKTRHEPIDWGRGPVWIRASIDGTRNGYSYDDGKTWTKQEPENGTKIAVYETEYGTFTQMDPRKMPTLGLRGFDFDGTQTTMFARSPTAPKEFRIQLYAASSPSAEPDQPPASSAP